MVSKQFLARFWVYFLGIVIVGIIWIQLIQLFPSIPKIFPLLVAAIFGLLFWFSSQASFYERFVGAATAETLGAIRILVCGVALIMVLIFEDAPSTALLPENMRQSMGFMDFFYKFRTFALFSRSEVSLQIFEWVTILLIILGIIGWKTRIVLPLMTLCYFLTLGLVSGYVGFRHTGLIPLYIMAILSLTPCGDGLSVDRWRKIHQGQNVVPANCYLPIYGWSRYACWVGIAMPYVEAGMSKLRNGGFFWWEADNIKYHLYTTALDPMQFDFSLAVHLSQAPAILFSLLGLSGVYGELFYGLVLFIPKSRWLFPPLMALMHLGILFFQDILFLDLILLQLIFVDYTKFRHGLKSWKISLPKLSSQKFWPTHFYKNNQLLINSQKFSDPDFLFYPKKLRDFYYPCLISLLAVILLGSWFANTKFYPFTPFPMFSEKNETGIVYYYKLFAHHQSGQIQSFRPEKVIPAVFDTRYRNILYYCFTSKSQTRVCDDFLVTTGNLSNQKYQKDNPISKLEVQRYAWNFKENLHDANHGQLIKQHWVLLDSQ